MGPLPIGGRLAIRSKGLFLETLREGPSKGLRAELGAVLGYSGSSP